MKYLSGNEEKKALEYIAKTAQIALNSTCERSRCGSLIVQNFIRLDKNGTLSRAGKPYCTICSKMALDVGIDEFVLWHEDGICVYDTDEYNTRSFQYS